MNRQFTPDDVKRLLRDAGAPEPYRCEENCKVLSDFLSSFAEARPVPAKQKLDGGSHEAAKLLRKELAKEFALFGASPERQQLMDLLNSEFPEGRKVPFTEYRIAADIFFRGYRITVGRGCTSDADPAMIFAACALNLVGYIAKGGRPLTPEAVAKALRRFNACFRR